jgi:hypothetical protein
MVGEACAGAVEQAHHDLGVDEVFGAAQGDKAHGGGSGWGVFGHIFIVLRIEMESRVVWSGAWRTGSKIKPTLELGETAAGRARGGTARRGLGG